MSDPTPPPLPEQPPTIVVRPRAAASAMSTSKKLRLAMLVVTGIWVASMLALIILNFAGYMADDRYVWTGDYVAEAGSMAPAQRRAEFVTIKLVQSVVGGVCCPTVPFAIVMTCLGVALLAAKR